MVRWTTAYSSQTVEYGRCNTYWKPRAPWNFVARPWLAWGVQITAAKNGHLPVIGNRYERDYNHSIGLSTEYLAYKPSINFELYSYHIVLHYKK